VGETRVSKYQPLADHLARLQADEWRPTFYEMERLMGSELPQSARRPSWWKNDGGGHATTWCAAGWEVDPKRVDIAGEQVAFRRVRPVEETRSRAPALEADAEDAADEVYAHEGSVETVRKVAGGGMVAAALAGLALGVGVVALRGLFRRR